MRKLYSEAIGLKRLVSDREVLLILTKLVEAIQFSDPTSSQILYEQEAQLYKIFGEVKESIQNKDIDKVKDASEKFLQQLEVRNSMCKFSKRKKL